MWEHTFINFENLQGFIFCFFFSLKNLTIRLASLKIEPQAFRA